MNSTSSWSLQPQLSLTFTLPTSLPLLVRLRFSTVPLLNGSSVTWMRKLSSSEGIYHQLAYYWQKWNLIQLASMWKKFEVQFNEVSVNLVWISHLLPILSSIILSYKEILFWSRLTFLTVLQLCHLSTCTFRSLSGWLLIFHVSN